MIYRLTIFILILLSTHYLPLTPLVPTQVVTSKSDFVKKTNLLVRIRQRTELLLKIANINELLLKETNINKQKKLRTEHAALTQKRDNFDIYLKNLSIESLKDPIESLILIMDLADIHYKDTRLIAHKKKLLESSKNKAEKERLKREITTLEQNNARTNTLLKKTIIKNLDTAQEIPKPTKEMRKKAKEVDEARKKQKATQILNSPAGKKMLSLEQTVPLSQQTITAIDAILLGLDIGIDSQKNAPDRLKKNIGQLSTLTRSLRALYDKENRLLAHELSSLYENKDKHKLFIDAQRKKEITKKPNPSLGDRKQAQEHEYSMLAKLLEHEKVIMSALGQAHKKALSIQRTLEKKHTNIPSNELPILYGFVKKLTRKATLISTTTKRMITQFTQTFKHMKQEMADLSKLLAEEITP